MKISDMPPAPLRRANDALVPAGWPGHIKQQIGAKKQEVSKYLAYAGDLYRLRPGSPMKKAFCLAATLALSAAAPASASTIQFTLTGYVGTYSTDDLGLFGSPAF